MEEDQCLNFAKSAVPSVLPVLLEALGQQSFNKEEYDVAGALESSITLFTQTTKSAVLPYIGPFVTQYMKDADYKKRNAAIMAFSAIVEISSDSIQILPVLLEIWTQEKETVVKDSMLFVFGNFLTQQPDLLRGNSELLKKIISVLLEALNGEVKIATRACWGLFKLAETFPEMVSSLFVPCVTALLNTADRLGSGEDGEDLATGAFEAISQFVTSSEDSDQKKIEELFGTILARSEKCTAQGADQKFLLSTLGSCFTKMQDGSVLASNLDRVVQVLLGVLSSDVQRLIREEAFMSLSTLLPVLPENLVLKYMDALYPLVLRSCMNYEEKTICQIAIGVIGDVSRKLDKGLLPYGEKTLSTLVTLLQVKDLPPDVVSHALAAFGDVALALQGEFSAYLPIVMSTVFHLQITEKMAEWMEALNGAICECFTGVIQGLKSENKQQAFLPYVEQVAAYIVGIYRNGIPDSDKTIRESIGVLGDLAHTFGTQVKHIFQQEKIKTILAQVQPEDDSAVEVVNWSCTMIEKVLRD
eukprot:Phypoly_transcript_06153.p1 GENE.Phypoly_transcript_06153~~Phypoly_transcript_06153.p1  ORF type:complete len:580 (-),score=94.63 Phypoly_transcript_06153:96-1682(-)